MAATPEEISQYLTNINYGLSVYSDQAMLKERLGHPEIFKYRLRTTLLSYYVEIMTSYFAQEVYDDNNFFTTEEVLEIISRINRLCDSNYTIEL